jgi:predicted exporter
MLVSLAHHVDERLAGAAPREAGVAGTLGLATVLPDAAVVERRRSAVGKAQADRVVADFRAALADSDFQPAVYEPYTGFLRTLMENPKPPGAEDLLRYRRLAQTMLPSTSLAPGAPPPTEAITLVSLSHPIDDRAERAAAVNACRRALADLPGATVTGLPVLGHDAEAGVQRAVPRLFGVSMALVLGYVILHFRSARDATLSLSTAAFGMIVLLAVMRIAHVRLNMINLIALPLLIGMTVDYGIFLVSLARVGRKHGTPPEALRDHVASSAQAVLVCAGATLLGFGSLAFISVPAVRSLGIVVMVGMAAALLGALFLLTPILLLPAKPKPGPRLKSVSEPVETDASH